MEEGRKGGDSWELHGPAGAKKGEQQTPTLESPCRDGEPHHIWF